MAAAHHITTAGTTSKNTHLPVDSLCMATSWLRSTIKLLWGMLTDSWVAMRVKILSVNPTTASAAGTKAPTWARKTMRATCLA